MTNALEAVKSTFEHSERLTLTVRGTHLWSLRNDRHRCDYIRMSELFFDTFRSAYAQELLNDSFENCFGLDLGVSCHQSLI